MSQHSSRGRQWNAIRQQVLERDGHVCVVPGCNAIATHVDHIVPKSLGGTDDLDNLQAMCRPHNLKKGTKVLMRQNYFDTEFFPSGLPKTGA